MREWHFAIEGWIQCFFLCLFARDQARQLHIQTSVGRMKSCTLIIKDVPFDRLWQKIFVPLRFSYSFGLRSDPMRLEPTPEHGLRGQKPARGLFIADESAIGIDSNR